MAVQIDLREAEGQLPALLDRAVAGEEIIITSAGRQMVRLEPVPGARFENGAGGAAVGHG